MRDTVVFVDGTKVEVPSGSTVLDAVRAHSAQGASAVEQGARVILDDRGLPLDLDTPVHGGRILRLVPVRSRDAGDTTAT